MAKYSFPRLDNGQERVRCLESFSKQKANAFALFTGVVKKVAKQAESTGRKESRVRVYQFTKVFIAVDERKTWEQARAVCNGKYVHFSISAFL